MKILSKVLWAIDLNSDHDVSIEKMKTVMEQFGNDLILLHVLPAHLKGKASEKKIARSLEYEIKNEIAERLKLSENHQIKVRVEVGEVAEKINQVATEENVNLVVLNKGKSPTLGANGFNTIRKLKKPVVVLSQRKPGYKKHIVCPVNNSKESAIALKSALLHARKINAKLSVISVYKPYVLNSARLMKAGLNEEIENKYHLKIFRNELKTFLKDFDFSNVNAEVLILKGDADDQIIKFAQRAGVLYVGSGGKRSLQRAFKGSVSEKVIREVGCPVVLVKKEPVFKLRIPSGLENVEKHFKRGSELRKLGFLHESVVQFKKVLKINELHFLSIRALAELYNELGNKSISEYYKEMHELIEKKMLHRKIEEEVRRTYRTVT